MPTERTEELPAEPERLRRDERRENAEIERGEQRHDDGEDRRGWWGFRR